jgi:hypothetical protein
VDSTGSPQEKNYPIIREHKNQELLEESGFDSLTIKRLLPEVFSDNRGGDEGFL